MELLHGRTILTERRAASADTELGTIHVLEEGGRASAYWCGVGDATDVFLCAIEASAYNSQPEVRTRFMELATAVAGHRERGVIVGKVEPAPWWAELPCARCSAV